MNYSFFIKSLKYILLFFSIAILILVVYNNNPIEKEKVEAAEAATEEVPEKKN